MDLHGGNISGTQPQSEHCPENGFRNFNRHNPKCKHTVYPGNKLHSEKDQTFINLEEFPLLWLPRGKLRFRRTGSSFSKEVTLLPRTIHMFADDICCFRCSRHRWVYDPFEGITQFLQSVNQNTIYDRINSWTLSRYIDKEKMREKLLKSRSNANNFSFQMFRLIRADKSKCANLNPVNSACSLPKGVRTRSASVSFISRYWPCRIKNIWRSARGWRASIAWLCLQIRKGKTKKILCRILTLINLIRT